jgi:class 3 adenylate cyclase/CHASE2 domain-containing sensor protein
MTRSERRLLRNTAILGLLLTLLVLVLDLADFLGPAERFAYDWRAEHFQHFTGPPTTQLVHLDIDDPSLEAIGRWPWHRAKLAEIVDELRIAGCKAVAFDVLFTSPEDIENVKVEDAAPPTTQPGTRPTTRPSNLVLARPTDNDSIFAHSLQRFGNAVVPLSLNIANLQTATPYFPKVKAILLAHPEYEPQEVAAALAQAGLAPADVTTALADVGPARKESLFELIEKQLQSGPKDLRAIRRAILPNVPENVISSPQLNTLRDEYEREQALQILRKFTRPAAPPFPQLPSTKEERATIPILGRAAASTGFVDYIPSYDGTVRFVPLYADHLGHAFPHVGLALACAMLGVDLQKVQVSDGKVTLPCPDGRRIEIPVHEQVTSKGRRLGMFFDIPWFGKSGRNQWETMYDYPAHALQKQHMSMAYIYEAREIQDKIERMSRNALDGIAFLITVISNEQRAPAEIESLFQRAAASPRSEAVVREIDAMLASDDLAFYLQGTGSQDFKNDVERQRTLKLQAIPGQLRQIRGQLIGLGHDLQTRRMDLAKQLGGKAALVGYISVGAVADQVPTPLHPRCPGVVIHGVVFNAIITGRFWHPSPRYLNVLLILLLGFSTTFLVARVPGFAGIAAIIAVALGYLIINCYLLFDYAHHLVPLAAPMAACLAVGVGCTGLRYVQERLERLRWTIKLGGYVDPALMRYVMENDNPILTGQQKDLTVVFTDLAGFTTISEQVKEGSVKIIKEYMAMMIPIVHKYDGYLNKLLGDGIMFIFNAPEDLPAHAVNATLAVLDMQQVMPAFNESLKARGLPAVAVRAGAASGIATMGNVGAMKFTDYTGIGDTVNLAARLEGANKAFGSKTLINQHARELVGDRFLLRPIGKIQVKGKSESVMTYEPLADAESATPEQKHLADLTAKVVDAFIHSHFQACLDAIAEMEKELGPSKLTDLYRDQAADYLRTPPPGDFEGQIALHEK